MSPEHIQEHIQEEKKLDSIHYDWAAFAFVGITPDRLRQWVDAYPGIDVEAEIRKAASWCRDNPPKARLKRQWARFLGNWFSRAHDRQQAKSTPGDLSSHDASAEEAERAAQIIGWGEN